MIPLNHLKQASENMIADLEARASLAGFFEFPHGNFKRVEKYNDKVENWNRWTSQLNRGSAIAALDMQDQTFEALLEAIARRDLNF